MLSIDKQILFLLSRLDTISVQRFIEIYSTRGYSPQSVRNVLSRLKQAGYVVTSARSLYSITPHGRSTLHSIANKGYHYGDEWDGQWHLVMFEIAEAERSKRYQFKNALQNLGFAPLYTNTFISPWNYVEEVDRLRSELDLVDHVTQMKGTFQQALITPEKANKMWQLDHINELHLRKWEWFHTNLLPRLESYRQEANYLQIFVCYLELGEAMGEVVIADPMLPWELLPDNWMGQKLLIAFGSLFSSLYKDVPKDTYYYEFMTNE